jgi:hypothetical protein
MSGVLVTCRLVHRLGPSSMRRFAAISVFAFFGAAGTASAQAAAAPGNASPRRGSWVPLRAELLQPVGPVPLESLHVTPDSPASIERGAPVATAPTRARSLPSCPMPVARQDTAALERMPVGRDSTRVAPMPVARGCENPLAR